MAALLDAGDCALVLIDVQEGFTARLEDERREPFLARAAWLTAAAVRLDVPLLVTVENAADMGAVHDDLARWLPAGTPVHDKRTFGLCGDEGVLGALRGLGRRTPVLAGMETDVCVSQSALGLQEAGFAPVVVPDACESPRDGHAHGLERLRGAGIPLVSAKIAVTEWLRTPEACRRFERAHPELVDGAPVLL